MSSFRNGTLYYLFISATSKSRVMCSAISVYFNACEVWSGSNSALFAASFASKSSFLCAFSEASVSFLSFLLTFHCLTSTYTSTTDAQIWLKSLMIFYIFGSLSNLELLFTFSSITSNLLLDIFCTTPFPFAS